MRSKCPVGMRCALVGGDSAHPIAWGGKTQIGVQISDSSLRTIAQFEITEIPVIGMARSQRALRPR
jgi:hypothetical protein